MYAKISNGVVDKYPYTFSDLRNEYPNTSFPSEFDAEVMESYGLVDIISSPRPDIGYDKTSVEGTPEFVNGVWRQTWVVINRSSEEAALIANQLRSEAYCNESDPIFFKSQRGEATHEEWLAKVAEIKSRYPE